MPETLPQAPRRRSSPNAVTMASDSEASLYRYRRLWIVGVLSVSLVALIPLVIMVAINYYQYQKEFIEEVKNPMRLRASNTRRSLQFFLRERKAALNFVVHDKSFSELSDQRMLTRIFRNMKDNYSGVVDIGLIDGDGVQGAYVGPYGLKNKVYRDQEWFEATLLRGTYVSDVFMGYRQSPHFAIAVKNVDDEGRAYILRATLNASILDSVQGLDELRSSRDAFIVNREGVLQTASRRFGPALGKLPIPVPPPTEETRIIEQPHEGRVRVIGYVYIPESPFIFMVVEQWDTLLTAWFALRNKLFVFLGISSVIIVIVVLMGSTYLVNRVREADDKRVALLHKVEYTAKMASIGRLAAGVAHEINNPLAIINEKAGLLKDVMTYSDSFPDRDRFLKHVDPILASVERCARITRRLLGFAKHMDLRQEPIKLENLLREVLGFLEKESSYRNIKIRQRAEENVPVIESDRGRLQQVFLNIVNNAFGAVEDGGLIDIDVRRVGSDRVSVTIEDNGCGIRPEDLQSIFEPFFTTKQKHGTGLGLSITYGIVEKLGGKISVDSQLGAWTRFTVVLPIRHTAEGASDGADAGTAG